MPLNIALIFPGQGSQKVGMGLEFYNSSAKAKAIFDEADKIFEKGLSHNHCLTGACPLSKVIFEGPEEKLTATAFCQPAIFTASAAILEAFKAHPKYKNYTIKFTAGHSLGEYAALYAAGMLPFEHMLRLVQQRATCMEEATQQTQGAMAAVIGFDKAKLLEICQQTGAEVANFNSHEQIVITGHKPKLEAAMEAVKAAGGQKVIPLSVSGAFHSSLMANAANRFSVALKDIVIHPSPVEVLSNVTARPQKEADEVRDNLAKQITASVQWVGCMEYIISQGITEFIEIGPGKVLKGLMRRINPSATVHNIEKPSDIEALAG